MMLKPHNNIPRMTREEIMGRAEAKQQLVLDFLSSGEVWTTGPLLSQLLGLSARRAQALAARMERDSLLKAVKGTSINRV